MEPPAHASSSSSSRHGGALEKLKSVVTKCAMASAPSNSLSVQHTAFIEKRIQELLPTPDHPPYAWMIENAIKELNLEGSCLDEEEEAISNFISREYKGLHWAHSALLHHHFNKLSKTGDLITHHHNLIITSSSSPSPVSSSTPSYASTDQSSASSQSFERARTRKKKKKKKAKRNFRNKSGKLKKRMHARGMSNWDGEMMNQVQVGSDICLGGMGEVDIQSLLTEDETTNDQEQQHIIEAHGINDQHQHSGDDSSTPTTFPSNARTRRIRKHRKKPQRQRGRSRKTRESESNVNGVEQDSMDELIEQVYGELTGTLDGGRNVQIHQAYDVINEQEQQQESRRLVEKQKHIKEDQFGSEQIRSKPRPRPYRNVADIYESSSPDRRSDGKSSRPL